MDSFNMDDDGYNDNSLSLSSQRMMHTRTCGRRKSLFWWLLACVFVYFNCIPHVIRMQTQSSSNPWWNFVLSCLIALSIRLLCRFPHSAHLIHCTALHVNCDCCLCVDWTRNSAPPNFRHFVVGFIRATAVQHQIKNGLIRSQHKWLHCFADDLPSAQSNMLDVMVQF